MIGLIKGTARQIKTVSGLPLPIASYKSNSKSPIQELSLSINPTQSGSGDPAPDNIRPITGVSSVNVTRTGKNLFDITKMSDRSGVTVSGNTFSGLARSFTSSGLVTPFFAKSGSVLTVQATTKSNGVVTSGAGFALLFVYADNTTVRPWYTNNNETSETHHTGTVTATSDIVGYRFVDYNSGTENTWTVKDFQIEFGSTASDYEPYTGNTYIISLGGTYYGATLDVVRGKLRVTHNVWVSNGSENWIDVGNGSYYTGSHYSFDSLFGSDNGKSNYFKYKWSFGQINGCMAYTNRIQLNNTSFSSVEDLQEAFNQTPLVIVYPLATPIEIDLTPTQINSLLGQNHIWHDGNGDVESLKFMDRQLYFGR